MIERVFYQINMIFVFKVVVYKMKSKTLKNISTNLICKVLVFASLLLTLPLQAKSNPDESIKAKEVYSTAINNLKNKFFLETRIDFKKWEDKKVKNIDDAYLEINKLVKELNDPYTRHLTKEEFKDEQGLMKSSFVGIGVKLASNAPQIIDVIKDSPASKEDLRSNDLIVKVNDKNTKGLNSNQISNLLRGQKDTFLTLAIKRDKNILVKTLKRSDLNFQTVSSRDLGENLALVKIDSFIPENTSRFVKEELMKLMSKDGIVLDLRNNSGGLFKNAVEIADMFLAEGEIVSTVTKSNKVKDFAHPAQITKSNIVILVNERTASASEILTGALKENKRAIVIGRKTYGKGLVQEVVELPDKSGLHVTIAAYLTPSGKCINKIGIIPDILVNNDDEQLNKAKEILQSLKEQKPKIALISKSPLY